MSTRSGLDYHRKMSLVGETNSHLTQDSAFRDLSKRVDRLTPAMEASHKNILKQMQEVRKELTPRTIRDSREGRGVHTLDHHSGHGFIPS